MKGHAHAFSLLLLGTIAFSIPLTLNAEKPFDFASTPGKLPKNVVPQKYSIRIKPDLTKLTFSGSEAVKIEVRQPVRELVLNALELQITSASVDETAIAPAAIKLDAKEETLKIALPEELPAGTHTLDAQFHRQNQSTGTRPVLRALPGTGNECAKDHARDAIRGDRCAPLVSLLGRTEFPRALSTDRGRAGKFSRRFQHAGGEREQRSPAARKCVSP